MPPPPPPPAPIVGPKIAPAETREIFRASNRGLAATHDDRDTEPPRAAVRAPVERAADRGKRARVSRHSLTDHVAQYVKVAFRDLAVDDRFVLEQERIAGETVFLRGEIRDRDRRERSRLARCKPVFGQRAVDRLRGDAGFARRSANVGERIARRRQLPRGRVARGRKRRASAASSSPPAVRRRVPKSFARRCPTRRRAARPTLTPGISGVDLGELARELRAALESRRRILGQTAIDRRRRAACGHSGASERSGRRRLGHVRE